MSSFEILYDARTLNPEPRDGPAIRPTENSVQQQSASAKYVDEVSRWSSARPKVAAKDAANGARNRLRRATDMISAIWKQ